MPFQSEAQRRFMFAQHPRIAKRWAKHTPKGKNLPEKKTDSNPEETKDKAAEEAQKKASIRTTGIELGLIKNSMTAAAFFNDLLLGAREASKGTNFLKNLIGRAGAASEALSSKLKDKSLNFLDKKFFDYGGSEMLPVAAEVAPGALFYSLRDLPGHLSKGLNNRLKLYTLGGAAGGGLTGGLTGDTDGTSDRIKRILEGSALGAIGGAGGRGLFNLGKGVGSYAPMFTSKLKDLHKLYEGGTLPYLMDDKGLTLSALKGLKAPLIKAFEESKKLRSLKPLKEFFKKWNEDHFSKRNELNIKLLSSGGSGQGLMGADAIKNLGLDTINAGTIVNPNILKFITNPRYQKMLSDAGIKRLYGESYSTLRPVSDEANAASAKIREALEKLIQEKAPSGYNKLKGFQDILAKDIEAEIAAIKADTSLTTSDQLKKIRDLKFNRRNAGGEIQGLLSDKFDKYRERGPLKVLISDLEKQNLGLTSEELRDAVRARFDPAIRKVRDVFNSEGKALEFDAKLAPDPTTGIPGFDIPVYRDL